MFSAQTSLISVTVALARFLENEGPGAFFSNYPFWYLGSTPFRYLAGPVVPSVLTLTHRLLPSFSLFEIFFFWISVAWIAGGVGVYFLVKSLMVTEQNDDKRQFIPLLAAAFYLFGPIAPFLFPFADGVYLLAFSVLPFILFLYLKFLKDPTRRLKIFLVAIITFVLLIDTLIVPSLLLGMIVVFLAQVGWKRTEEKLKGSLVLLFFSFLVSTLWYTPGYWWTILGAPSFGGKGLAQVIVWLGKLLPVALGLALAVFSARFFKKRNLLGDFCFYWLFIFGFLTLIRFLSDTDFWLDWSSYGVELQLGLAVFGGIMLNRWVMHANKKRMKITLMYANVLIVFIIWLLIFNKFVLGTLQRGIDQTVEHRVGKWLSENTKPGEKVFLSGTTAFWLNAFFDIPQVRGGKDQASVDGRWRAAAWEIREGTDVEKSIKWFKELEISYLVVHAEGSKEFYHDFNHPEKFEQSKSVKKIFSDEDSIIYRVE